MNEEQKDSVREALASLYRRYEDQVNEGDLTKDDFRLKEAVLDDLNEYLDIGGF